jgi:hypothetical protein
MKLFRPRFIRNTGTFAAPDRPCPSSSYEVCACLERLYELITASDEPTLCLAELFVLSSGFSGKPTEYAIYITVKTADDRTLIASVNNAESGYGFDYYQQSANTMQLVIDAPGINKADCNGFKVRMQVKAPPVPDDVGWGIDVARLALYFTDGTTLAAEHLNFLMKATAGMFDGGVDIAEIDFASP